MELNGDIWVYSTHDYGRKLSQKNLWYNLWRFQFFFQFRTTNRERTIDSGKAFGEGAFPDEAINIPPPLDEDKLLKVRQYGNIGCGDSSLGIQN